MMNKEQIVEKYNGMFGVFTHDIYGFDTKEYAEGFLAAFGTYKDALDCGKQCGIKFAIHIIV